jgi:hypothetical protein
VIGKPPPVGARYRQLSPMLDYVINITEQNVRQYAKEQYLRDLEEGPSESEKRCGRDMTFLQEKAMSGQIEKPADDALRLSEFVANHLEHIRDANAVMPMLDGGKNVFVRLSGKLYHVRKTYSQSPLDMPLHISEATVVEAT